MRSVKRLRGKIDRSLLLRHFAGEKTARRDPPRIRVFINDALGIENASSGFTCSQEVCLEMLQAVEGFHQKCS
jgi:hypothetical protein